MVGGLEIESARVEVSFSFNSGERVTETVVIGQDGVLRVLRDSSSSVRITIGSAMGRLCNDPSVLAACEPIWELMDAALREWQEVSDGD